MKIRHLVMGLSLSMSYPVLAVPEMDTLFNQLQAEGRPAEEIILALVEAGVDLSVATGYSVTNAAGVGLAVAYAQAGICLAEDKAGAEAVAQQAIGSAAEESRSAVEARAVTIINGFDEGICRAIAEERTESSQAFAAQDGAAGGDSGAGGGAGQEPPAVDDEDPVSVSQ